MGDISSRATSLRAEHAQLDAAIRAEQARPAPDTLLIQTLKRQKLQAKEALGKLGLSSGKRKSVHRVQEVTPSSADIIEFPTVMDEDTSPAVVEQRMVAVAR